jgi:hypothetical protein
VAVEARKAVRDKRNPNLVMSPYPFKDREARREHETS